MRTETSLFDYDEATRRITIAKVLLERAQDNLEEIERSTNGVVRDQLEATSMLIALALEELPGSGESSR
jgi:hypothetical protein